MAGIATSQQEADARREVQWAEVGDLRLDPENPRLPKDLADSSQPALLATLAKEYELTELGQSIADHGYFSEEPLVVVVENGERIVVEGNRRLAAMKLLDEPEQAPQPYRKAWSAIAASRKVTVHEVPTLVYDERSQVTPYLGYRHITGVLPWGPYQKARYIAQLVEKAGMSFAEIARTIGSKSTTVREHYITYSLIRQAEDLEVDTSSALDTFGVLRRALTNPNIRDFIGLKIDGDETSLRSPLPEGSADRLRELFSFLFGANKVPAVMTDSRRITELGRVLSKSETIEVLRTTRNLAEAFRMSGGEEQLVVDTIDRATSLLGEASALAQRHKSSRAVVRAVSRVRKAFYQLDITFPPESEQ